MQIQNIPGAAEQTHHARLREVALQLEASFLSEMLKNAGFGSARESFGGGAGEEQFSSFLRDAQAKAIVDAGGIGLAQSIFESLLENVNDPRSNQ